MTEKIQFDEKILDELIKGCKTQEDLFGEKRGRQTIRKSSIGTSVKRRKEGIIFIIFFLSRAHCRPSWHFVPIHPARVFIKSFTLNG
jgi:hypothetical protein